MTSIPQVGVISKAIGDAAVPAGETLRSSDVAVTIEAIVVAVSRVVASLISSQSIQSAQLSVEVEAIPRVAAVVKVAKLDAVRVVVPDNVTVGAVKVILPLPLGSKVKSSSVSLVEMVADVSFNPSVKSDVLRSPELESVKRSVPPSCSTKIILEVCVALPCKSKRISSSSPWNDIFSPAPVTADAPTTKSSVVLVK